MLKDKAYEQIKRKILDGNVKHMSENSLVSELNMSRTPIREALFKLQHEGFLEIISNQGIMVNDLSLNRLEDLIDMRVAIETFSIKVAIELIDESDFEILESIVDEQIMAMSSSDIYSFRKLDGDFHLHLLNITDNYYFLKMYSEVYELQFTAQKKKMNKEYTEQLINDHKEIIHLLKEGQTNKLVEVLTNHINKGK